MNKAAYIYKRATLVTAGCFFISALALKAQAQEQLRGKVEVIKDSRIDTMIARRFSPQKGQAGSAGYSSFGYRVQFFTGSSRRDAFRAQTQFQELYPEIRTYISYKEPNFKVKAGDFRTRLEAVRLQQQLRSKFTALFILPERINTPPPLDPVNHD